MADLLSVVKAMADPTRLRLIAILDNEELSVNELVRIMSMGQSRISRHLAILKESGLVDLRREGTSSFYSIPPDADEHGLLQTFRDSDDYKSILKSEGPRIRRVLAERGQDAHQYVLEKIAEDWGDIRAELFWLRVRNRALAGLIPSDWVVADIGCGTGVMLMSLAPLVKKVIGVDHSREMLRVARRNARARNYTNIEFICAELDDLPLRDQTLDGLTANIVLHHAKDPLKAAREWARVLKPGGRVSTVELERHDYEWLREEMGDVWLGFEAGELAGFFRAAGFERVRVKSLMDELSTADMGARKTANVGIQLLTAVRKAD